MYYIKRAYSDLRATVVNIDTKSEMIRTPEYIQKLLQNHEIFGVVQDISTGEITDYITYSAIEFINIHEAEEYKHDICEGTMEIIEHNGRIFGLVNTKEYKDVYWVIYSASKHGALFVAYNNGYSRYLNNARKFTKESEAIVKAALMTKRSKTNRKWIAYRRIVS